MLVLEFGLDLTPDTEYRKAEDKWSGVDLLYLAPGDVTKGRIEPIYWMQTCQAFSEHGLHVHLMALRVRMPDGVDVSRVWHHFGITRGFRLTRFPTSLRSNSRTPLFQAWATAASLTAALGQALKPRRSAVVVYTKSPVMLSAFVTFRRFLPHSTSLVLELHALPTMRAKWIVRNADLVVASSSKLAADLARLFALDESQILVEPPPAPIEAPAISKREARKELGISERLIIGCYSGKMISDQIDFLLEATGVLRQALPQFCLMLVGGNPDARRAIKRRAEELGVEGCVEIVGFVPPAEVRTYQSAADVLLLHMTSSTATWEYATPAKAFDYMASNRPIVATTFPLFADVFGPDHSRAVEVTDHDPEQFAAAVVGILSDTRASQAMARRASAWVRRRSWSNRTARVLSTLEVHDRTA